MPKILYVGFGISPFIRGGAVIYQESLVEAINRSGWDTVCFFAAPRYTNALAPQPFVKEGKRGKIRILELCDSPNIYGYFNPPLQQCRHPGIENLMEKILEQEKPDIVHFHELQIHTASLMDVVRKRNIPAIKTMHNYFDVCSQRDLMYRAEELCGDFKNGKRCVECLKILPVKSISLTKRMFSAILPAPLVNRLASFYSRIRKNDNTPGRDNEPPEYPAGDYCRRREFFIESLNKLDAVHCSSRRSAEIFIHYGVFRDKIKVIPLAVKSLEYLAAKPQRNTRYPVVFGYVGGMHVSRGYQVLMDAFSRLDQSKAKLIIFLNNAKEFTKSLNVEVRSPYDIGSINKAFEDIDVGVVPSIWEEIFGIIGIEWLSSGIPVIASNIGGIPEWLKDGENGFLVSPASPLELFEKMELFIKNPALIAEFQQKIKPWKSFGSHIEEITGLYKQLIKNN